ncbi:MAG: hypothetical protein ACNS61_08075, partial [Candidatus Wenzhouxiangella sp. M2_3B_020]
AALALDHGTAGPVDQLEVIGNRIGDAAVPIGIGSIGKRAQPADGGLKVLGQLTDCFVVVLRDLRILLQDPLLDRSEI